MSYKNFWSLNTDEAVVTGLLRDYFKKDVEVFIPLNAQLKDIDLVAINLKNKKIATLQVKGSRTYEPKPRELEKFGNGSAGWYTLSRHAIENCTADYFTFLQYVFHDVAVNRRHALEPHMITLASYLKDSQEKVCKNITSWLASSGK